MVRTLAMPGRVAARLVGTAGVVAGMVASAAVVWHSSYSAFSATTSNATNNWAAGSVALSDDDSNTAMFTSANASNLKPSSTGTKCIVVTSTGTLPAAVKLYGTGFTVTNGLATYLNLTITQGSGGSFNNCTGYSSAATVYSGTLAGFAGASTNFATGQGSWATTGSPPEAKTFQFTWTLDPATPNSVQGGTAAIGFTWEAQNS